MYRGEKNSQPPPINIYLDTSRNLASMTFIYTVWLLDRNKRYADVYNRIWLWNTWGEANVCISDTLMQG